MSTACSEGGVEGADSFILDLGSLYPCLPRNGSKLAVKLAPDKGNCGRRAKKGPHFLLFISGPEQICFVRVRFPPEGIFVSIGCHEVYGHYFFLPDSQSRVRQIATEPDNEDMEIKELTRITAFIQTLPWY